jgi:signal transduction histidine kinase
MLIRHKIILWFILFTGLLLCFFSVYIYIASSNSIKNSFIERIKNKALATKEIYELNDKVAEKIINSIPEQSEYVFDEQNQLIFAINDLHDFKFDNRFFSGVAAKGEYTFSYSGKENIAKEGYAFAFYKGTNKRTIAITAFNKNGLENLKNLASILIIGNLFFLIAIGLAAYTFSVYVFRPINDLVKQVELVRGHDLSFRLSYVNPKDEIGIVASSFNKALNRVQTLVESQKSFISYASHELRTPLAAINGILETSLDYDKDQEVMRLSLAAARKEIHKATSLVNGLLQLAKIESADQIVDFTRINIVDVLLDAISFFKLKNPKQQFSFDIPEVTHSQSSIEVNGHAQLLRTAFINLIDNASKYSHEKKIDIKLTVESDQKILVRIIDNGIGIHGEEERKLFEPFYRGKNTSSYEGAGLGLSLTQRIFELHQGSVMLLKNQSEGSTAEVRLPAIISE